MPSRKELEMEQATMFDTAVDKAELGRRIDQALEDGNLTVQEMSFETRIGESLLRRYISGSTAPGAARLARIAKYLNVNADWLLQNTENRVPVSDPWVEGESPDRRATPQTSGGAPAEELSVPRKQPGRRRSA